MKFVAIMVSGGLQSRWQSPSANGRCWSRRYAERIWGEFFILVRRILGKLLAQILSEFWWQILIANFSALFFQGFRSPKKIHAQNSRPELSAFLSNFTFLNPKFIHGDFLLTGETKTYFCLKISKKNRNIFFFKKMAVNIWPPNFYQTFFWVMSFLFFPSSSSSSFSFSSSVSSFCLLPLLIFVFFLPPLLSLFIIILFLLLLSPSDSRSLLPGSLDSVAHFQLPFPAQSSIVFRVICIDLRRYWVS